MPCHFSVLYFAYVACYLINSWIPFNINVLLIFTAVFIAIYLTIWITVLISLKLISKRLNAKIR